MEPRELLKALMERDELNANSLAVKLKGKVTQPNIHKFVTGVSKEPRRSTLRPLADYFNVDLDAFYDPDLAEATMRELGLQVQRTEEPAAAAYAPAPAPAPEFDYSPEVVQLMQDLADLQELNPLKRSKFLDMVHQAAEEAREVARHIRSKGGKVAAARKTVVKKAQATISWGDGNDRQTSLNLATVHDPFTAAPSDRESALYTRIERAPKK